MIIEIDLKQLYGEVVNLNDLASYVTKSLELAGKGNEVVLTSPGPVWLYFKDH